MNPLAAQNNSPHLWCHGELTEAQAMVIDADELACYRAWCEQNARPWCGLSDLARTQGRRVRNRILAHKARRTRASQVESMRAELAEQQAENSRLRAQVAQLQCQAADSLAEFNFTPFDVVYDIHGRPMMYIGQ